MFPERLRFLREQKNIPQKELGKMFNLSKQTISAYERGETSPSIDTVVLFADFFGVTTDFLLGKQTEAVEEEGLFYNLSEEEKRAVRGHADSKITFSVYGHVLPKNRRRLADRFDELVLQDTQE